MLRPLSDRGELTMAENDSDQERTEQPTQKRLEEARKQGQVPRSPELNAAAVVLIAGVGLHFLGAHHGHAAARPHAVGPDAVARTGAR